MSGHGVVGGREAGRLELTEETTYGYEVIDFADLIGWPLDPWQRWSVIHGAGNCCPTAPRRTK